MLEVVGVVAVFWLSSFISPSSDSELNDPSVAESSSMSEWDVSWRDVSLSA